MMKRQRVGVIGAGISGVVAAAHLKKEGVDVIVFERSSAAGGVWLYDERKPLEPLYSSLLPSKAGLANIPNGSNGHKFDASQIAQLLHAPPGPCYVGLNNNVSTRLLETTLNPFPPATPDFVSHEVLKNYIQDTASVSGIQDAIRYNTEVQRLSKGDGKWTVDASVLDVATGSIKKRREIWKFDSVIVASGHYHAPRIPDIPGLAQWKQKWPHRIQHSKSYKRPEDFEQGKNFLLIGGSVSATDIARELSPRAKTIYQSHRNGAFDLPPSLLPENAIRIGEIASFDNPETSTNSKGEPDAGSHLPLAITLKSGERLCDIDYVIICTGYHITLPFLSHLHDDFTEPSRASQSVLVTDGLQLHNLHKDMWYIPDPSLIFIGVPYFTATFTLFEFQAIVVAKVVGRGLPLPSEAELRKEYEEKIREKGLGKSFHSLRDAEEAYVDNLLLWLNEELDRAGFTQEKVPGHTEKWKVAKEEQRQRMQQLFTPNGGVTSNGVEKAHWWNC